LTWSLVFNSTFVKLVVNNGIHPYMVEPASIGVLREDTPHTDRQEAIVQTYYITKSELYARLYLHPKREQIVKRITTSVHTKTEDLPEGVDRILMSQTNPTHVRHGQSGLEWQRTVTKRVSPKKPSKCMSFGSGMMKSEDYQVRHNG